MQQERTLYAVEIPKLGSLILAHDANATIRGLKEWPRDERPNATIVFWSFRVMVGVGFLMIAVGLWSLWLRWRRRLYEQRWLLRAMILLSPAGLVAIIAGWVTTEVGRQPYTVYGLLRTSQSASSVASAAIGSSLVAFVVVYLCVFAAGVFYMLRLMKAPPKPAEVEVVEEEEFEPQQPMRASGLMPAPIMGRRHSNPPTPSRDRSTDRSGEGSGSSGEESSS
jgi:cytochrome d ubiquinol oxidase subunit I